MSANNVLIYKEAREATREKMRANRSGVTPGYALDKGATETDVRFVLIGAILRSRSIEDLASSTEVTLRSSIRSERTQRDRRNITEHETNFFTHQSRQHLHDFIP
jgi:hypothetical protein